MQVWIYSVAASTDPDFVRCVVPWRVDGHLIFFGPCKKLMRERLRKRFLSQNIDHRSVTDQLFIVGINGAVKHLRKIIWAGRLTEVMTFAHADTHLTGARFQALRNHPASPLHVSPIFEAGELRGYRHVSLEHSEDDAWVADLVSRSQNVRLAGQSLTLLNGNAWEAFDRDCCMLLQNMFFAQGQGIEFDGPALDVLRRAQPEKPGIDSYAVFGRNKKGSAIGLRGTFLEISGDVAEQFISWLNSRCGSEAQNAENVIAKTRCT